MFDSSLLLLFNCSPERFSPRLPLKKPALQLHSTCIVLGNIHCVLLLPFDLRPSTFALNRANNDKLMTFWHFGWQLETFQLHQTVSRQPTPLAPFSVTRFYPWMPSTPHSFVFLFFFFYWCCRCLLHIFCFWLFLKQLLFNLRKHLAPAKKNKKQNKTKIKNSNNAACR